MTFTANKSAIGHSLAGSGAIFIDLKGEFDTLYGEYIDEAIVLSLLGFLAIVVALGRRGKTGGGQTQGEGGKGLAHGQSLQS